jgi:glucose-6-phosphate isomerase
MPYYWLQQSPLIKSNEMNNEFKVEGLKLNLGDNAGFLESAIKKANQDQLVKRIWERDHTVWKPSPDEISNRLGWLDIAARMRAEIPALRKLTDSVSNDGMDRVLLLGMGGSSLAPELFSQFFAGNGLKLTVLDSTDADAVREKEEAHEPSRTLYIVSSKSGGTTETHSFFKYFYNKALAKLGQTETGKHFIAITDPDSNLAKIGEKLNFRHAFLADPNIGGRYSALSHFGLVPAALIDADLDRLLASADRMAELCRFEDTAKNPGALLGLVLGNLALLGRDRATFTLPPDKAAFGDWVEQLIAESTGKEGKGILPVVREPKLKTADYGEDRVFISNDGNSKLPQIEILWQEDYELGGQFFLWEFAIAIAGYVSGINPFDQPNVESAKIQARDLVATYQKTKSLPKGDRQKLSWSAIQKFVKNGKVDGYIALQAYAKPNTILTNCLDQLRSVLSHQTKLATTFGYGPRFLHSTGQLHKGDSGKGLFIQFITPPPKPDLPIPKEYGDVTSDLGFGILKLAQALGDAQALRRAGRAVLSFEIPGDPVEAMQQLLKEAVNG